MATRSTWRRTRIERGVYMQPNGKYTVCVRVGGKPRFRTVDAATVAEARRQRLLLTAAAHSGELVLTPTVTFAEVAARWLAEFETKVAAGTRRERTLELYRNQLERHLLPRLGRRRLQLITTDELAELIADLQAQGLAAWTVRGIMVPLGCVFGFAVRRGHLVQNPLRRLEPDERPHPGPRRQRVLTQDELRRLLAACPIRYRPLLATAVYTGMRFSEVLALSWADVDFAAAVIHVRHQLARARTGRPAHRMPPKTPAALREIPLLPQLAALLRQHKTASRFTAPSDYVFATRQGTPLLHRNVARRAFTRAVSDAGLQRNAAARVRFHDLRHTFASHLIVDVRLDVAQVSRILGHARTSMTLDTYTHLFEQAAHGADLRARLARSEFAAILGSMLEPRLLAGDHVRSTRAPRCRCTPKTHQRRPAYPPAAALTAGAAPQRDRQEQPPRS
jgi:integrase